MRRILSVFTVLALLMACTPQEEQKTIRVESISIDQADMTIEEGESISLTAKVLPEDAEDKAVKWSSSDESKVMVSSSGKAVAMAVGKAVVTAQAGEAKDFITITVVERTIAVTGISLQPSELTIKVGETGALTPEITPPEASNKNVSWTSSNAEVATVEDGAVTGIKPGSVTITATTEDGGFIAECKVTVKSNLAPTVTVGADNISAVSAILMGKANLESTASADLKIGIQYSTSEGILPSNSRTVEATDADADYNYSVGITGLEPSTTYYYRSFVRQSGQDTFGETMEFTTKELSSLIHTKEVTALSAVSAKLNAELDMTDIQYKTKTVGFYWGISAESVTSKVTATEGNESFSADISELKPSTHYFYQAFIVLDGTELKESVLSFTAKHLESLLVTNDASDIEATSVTLNAKLDLTDVKYNNISYGFLWGSSESALNADSKCTEIRDNSISAALKDLSHKTQYWYKAYVILDGQTFYGEVKSFTTDVVPVQGVSLDKTEYTFHTIGNTLTLKATVLPADATDKSVEWSSDKESVATVDQSGTVKAVGNGTATITVTTKDQGKTATCAITVVQLINSISLNKTSLTLNEGEEETLAPTIKPDNAADKTLTWTSSDESIAKVDANGKVTAISKGTATIKASANDGSEKYAGCSVTVKRLVSSIQLNKTSLTLYRGGGNVTETLTATVNPSTANNTSVTWTSSNTTVATVSSSGVVTGKSRGNATITVTATDGSEVNATCEVEVKQNVTTISLSKTSLYLVIGKEETISVTSVLPDNANDKTYTWSSSDNAIASVDQNGRITAKAKGSATIKATANDGSGVSASCSVGVKNPCPSGAVDLGLSVDWATCNLSESGFVSSPAQYGDYYAWGETVPHYVKGHSQDNPCSDWRTIEGKAMTGYNWASYKWCNGSNNTLTKYNNNSSYGTVDNKIEFKDYDYADDAARQALGGKWRIPTDAEWTELIDNCTWTWTTQNGVSGILVTSKTNGNSIFLPAAGRRNDTDLDYVGSSGYYSSSLTSDPYRAWCVRFILLPEGISNFFYSNSYYRYYGFSVRPVSE